MLSILGKRSRGFCDGVSRRGFLRIGALGMGATTLSLADLLRAESQSPSKSSHKAVINVFLGGGPPHQDMWELKMDAPAEIRGEFRPINTNVSGIRICEVFPRIASVMDKCAITRAVIGSVGSHDAWQCMTGWPARELQFLGGRPSVGAVAVKVQGPVDPAVPAFVGLADRTSHAPWSDPGSPGFLGPAFGCFKPDGDGLANMKLTGVTPERLGDRQALLNSFDRMRRDVDTSGLMEGVDVFTEQAFNVLTSSRLLDALDLSKEDPRVVERYGTGKPYKYQYDGAPTVNEQLLLARRLIEAGVRCVTLSYGRWDSHGQNFNLVRDHGGKLDQCLSALIEDLDTRGMLDDVTVVAWGEFGRTPQVNKGAGRDHWPKVSSAILAGGGMRTGQAIGATNRLGQFAEHRSVHFQEIIATLYHNLGINPNSKPVADQAGRPQRLVVKEAIRELV
ncbi:MAG: DUF1501 domain-containing protein [Pirellulaceae bacterium]|jgi:hypothetical protein|nr:DUF1501 domain-containing protein [Pirellulaceae bacterium]MDP7016953.1 DUF1501 domain-containing protein [Pirellulaceae bacterium]